MLSPPTVHSGHTFFSASQIFLSTSYQSPAHKSGWGNETHRTYIISSPSRTSAGSSRTSFRLCVGSNTVLTPAASAPISFSLMPPVLGQHLRRGGMDRKQREGGSAPTAVTFPRSDISPVIASVGGALRSENSDTRPTVNAMPALGPSCTLKSQSQLL